MRKCLSMNGQIKRGTVSYLYFIIGLMGLMGLMGDVGNFFYY